MAEKKKDTIEALKGVAEAQKELVEARKALDELESGGPKGGSILSVKLGAKGADDEWNARSFPEGRDGKEPATTSETWDGPMQSAPAPGKGG